LRIGLVVQWVASSALYWSADEVGSQTPGRLQPGDLSLRYTSCRIPSICFRRSPPRSCLVRRVLRSCRMRSSGKSSGRSSGGRVGRQLGRLGPLTGLLVGRTHLSGTIVSLVSGDPRVPMSHRPLQSNKAKLLLILLKTLVSLALVPSK
jgi:hypothetical protein